MRVAAVLVVLLSAGALVGSALSQWRARPRESAGAGAVRPPGRVRVEVLNGGGRSGAAREATERLRDLGFDVVYFGNAREFGRDSSVVLDRVGHLPAARDVADGLGIRNVRSEPDSNLYLDVSVVLGTDWAPGETRPEATGAHEAHRAWWDPRSWLRR